MLCSSGMRKLGPRYFVPGTYCTVPYCVYICVCIVYCTDLERYYHLLTGCGVRSVCAKLLGSLGLKLEVHGLELGSQIDAGDALEHMA